MENRHPPVGGKHEPAPGSSLWFIGRDAETAELLAGLDDAIGGRGRLFLIAGEPGIGKTMLAERVEMHASGRGARVLWGRCWEGGGAPAYWPWIQILRPLLEEAPETAQAGAGEANTVARLFPELAGKSGHGEGAPHPPQSAAARFGLFAGVVSLLRRAASVQPLLLVFDDLHAADPGSLLLLRFVAGGLRGGHLMLVATYRDVEVARRADVAEALGELVREGPSIRLKGFDRSEVGRFVESLTGTSAPDGALSRICEATAGNPLFVREMVRLAGTGAGSGSQVHPSMPEGVRAVIHQRLASLDANAVRILSVAAVVGQDFELALVEHVSDLGHPDVLQSLAHAERFGLVSPAPSSVATFRFSHGLVREVLYDDLPVAVRKELHGRVGAGIERLHGPELSSRLGELAHHFAHVAATGENAKAIAYARQAGDRAMDACAYEEATVQYRRALEALAYGEPDETARCELLLRLGTGHARAGEYPQSKSSFVRAAEIARRLKAPEHLARAALGFGEPQVEGVVDRQLLSLLQESLGALSPEDNALRARVLARLSLELSFSEDPALRETRRDMLSREALGMARRLGDSEALGIALRARWLATWGPEGLEQRTMLSEEMLNLARVNGDREMELIGRARRITCSMEAGDMRAVEADVAAHVRMAEELRMPYHEWTATTLRSCRMIVEGTFGLAEDLAQKAPSLLPERIIARLAHLNQMTFIRWEQHRLGELRNTWQSIVERFPQTGFGLAWLSLAKAELGEEDDARRDLRTQIEAFANLPRGGLWLSTLAATSLAAAHFHDADAAAAVYPLLLPYAQRTIVIPMPHPVVCCGSASLYLGLLATAMTQPAVAAEHFESAIRMNTGLGARPLVARSQYESARVILSGSDGGDTSRAVELLNQAETTAQALGMASLIRSCQRLRDIEPRTAVPTARTGAAMGRDAGGTNVFQREGDYWTIVYEGSLVRLRDTKGLRYLSRLLSSPAREFHAIDLEGTETRTPRAAGPRRRPAELQERPDLGDAGALLDSRAKAEYKTRLQDLQADLDEAEGNNDIARAERIKAEIDFIVTELARAVGLGGRDRRAASHAERARLNVTRAIKAALDSIARNNPSLGQHLRSTIRTGRYCSYTPDPRTPIAWRS